MITIQCNGKKRELPRSTSIAALVKELGVAERKFAVERNRQVIPRDRLESELLEDGDEVNIVTLVGGG
ncbi:MAG: sulfur carrier protein ThiS [Polyangia bacterium]|jgi:thiamine biosynthesis protein ThiS|nr:sulfur carrier protein ThiS [Polyangia bacterium]